ncbi:MAG: VOC family protein [Chloroflexi bacterium]|nr:VOC family protein [Chloroflexota bacterium]
MSFTPAVFYKDPIAALAWLEKAFGFQTAMLITSPSGDDKMMHAEMIIAGKGRLMVGGEWNDWAKSPASVGGSNTANVHVQLESDIDGHCERARAAGAVVEMEPEDQFYGERTYRARDVEGHVWTFAQTVRQVSREEAEEASGLIIKGWV